MSSKKRRVIRAQCRQASHDRDHRLADASILFGAPYGVDQLQLAVVGLADDELADRAWSVLDAIASRHQLSDNTRRVIFAKIISAMIVDLWTGHDPTDPDGYQPDAMLNAQLDLLDLGLSHGLNERISRGLAEVAA